MKKVLKNLSLLLVACISFTLISNVKAVGSVIGSAASLSFGSSSFTRTFTFGGTGTSQSGVLTGKHSHFYQMYLNGYPALCFGLQQAARSGDVYQDTGVSIDTYSNSITMRKAYQYFINNPNDKQGFVVSQIAIWMVQFGGSPSSSEFLGYVTQAYQKFGYDIYNESVQKSMAAKVDAINGTTPYSGNLTVWVSNRIGGQPLIAPGTPNGIYACDDGTKKEEVTSCVTSYRSLHPSASVNTALSYCKTNICTVQTTCPGGKMITSGDVGECEDNNEVASSTFNYTATVGNDENVHRQYGEVENVAGLSTYCKLYCTETGTVVLPGGFGNALTSGTNVVWPTSANTKNTLQGNVFPLKFSGTKTCHLAIEDKNAPGQGCTYTPLEDYQKLYNTTTSLSRQTDVDGHTYEYVRTYEAVNKGGNYYVDQNYCGDLGTKQNSGDATYYTSNNSGYYTKYSANADSLRSSTASTAQSVQSCASDSSCHYNKCCIKSHQSKSCDITGHNCKTTTVCDKSGYASSCGNSAKYNSRVERNKTAVSNYESRVGNSINYCKSYINNFNATRNLSNEISKCFNYETVGCTGNSSTCSIYNFTAGATLNFEDTEYSYSNSVKQVDDVNYSCTNCTVASKMRNTNGTNGASAIRTFNELYTNAQMSQNITAIKSRVITVSTNNVSFEMDSPYKYVNKRTGKAATSPSEYTVDVGYSFLPLSYDNVISKKYEIGLSSITLGDTSGGTARFKASSNYVCHYTVKGTGSNDDECVCPEGTTHAGIDLFDTLKNSNGMTCADAQLKYCNDSSKTDENFPQDDKNDKYCPNDMSKKITACLNNGYTYNYCVNLICEGGLDSSYHCKNTNGVSGDMDITSCVYTKVLQGFSVSQAIDECDALVCPISGGIKIIYRTISLENPFPGKNIAKQVSGFNQDVKGRYPGTNWNSLDLVKNEILYNRGVSGSSVYKEEPLYTFVLTTDTIKRIRTYNDTRNSADGYADFTLDCKNKNSTACVSSFVHNRDYGLTSGTCASATSKNNFYTCSK